MPLRRQANALLWDEQKATARAFALTAAVYYLLIAVAHLSVLPPGKKALMAGTALLTSGISILARFMLKNGGPRATEFWMVVMVALVALNVTLHGVYVGDREQIYYLTTLLAAFPMLTPTGRTAGASILILLSGAFVLMANHTPAVSVSLAFLLAGPAIGGWIAAARTRGQAEVLAAAQIEAQQMKVLAEQSEAAKTQFLANMSHEIRTPLNGVIGVSELLADTSLSAKQKDMVDVIRGSSHMLERLLSDILDLSKIEAGKLHIETEPFDLETEVEAAASLLRPQAQGKALDFSVNIAEGTKGAYLGDAVRLKQIVSNLASNAIKFTEAGRVEVRVSSLDDEGPAGLRIEVSDTGPGIDEGTMQRLFQRFEQADGSTTRLHGGSGLGLSIVKSLAEMQGGSIEVDSHVGSGSRFTVRLPMERATRELGGAIASVPEVPFQAAHGPIDVLLAEDNAGNRRVIAMILEPYGVNLTIAEDGRQAVAAARKRPFDLILMDMQMPVMDGLAATSSIREMERAEGRRRTPIAMLSANALSTHRMEAEAAGCDAFIAKPIRPDDLLQGLAAILTDA